MFRLLFIICNYQLINAEIKLFYNTFNLQITYTCSAISQYERFDLWAIIINHVCPSPVAAARLGWVPDDLEMNYVP